MKRLFNSTAIIALLGGTAIIALLGGCASDSGLPSIEQSAPNPKPINPGYVESFGTTLPLISELSSVRRPVEHNSPSGIKRPNKAEINGTTWITELDPNSEYVLPVKTTNATGTSTVQQTLVTADLPIGEGSCSHKGFEAVPFGPAVAIAPLPGAPIGTEAACSVMVGGQIAKLIVKAQGKRSISELRFKANRKRNKVNSFPTGVCSHANYRVSKLTEDGPLGACVVVDATGANSATYVKLPANAYEMPVVKTGDGENARLANATIDKLPDGSRLVRIQGPQKQVVLDYPNKKRVVLTRSE